MFEQVAWLRARVGERVASELLMPYRRIETPLELDGKRRDTFIVGKRMPFLSSSDDAEQIARYVAKFEALVAGYTKDPELAPPVIKVAQRKPKKGK